MKPILGLMAIVGVLGVWAGFQAWQSAAITTNVQAGLAIVIGANLLLCLWLWRRAQPGSGDAVVLPAVAGLSASMLVGILPRLFWPAAKGLQIAGSIASLLLVTVLLVTQIRRRRRVRRAGPV